MSTAVKRTVIICIAAAVLLILALLTFFVVNEGESALILTFGKVTDQKGPGLYMKIPFVQTVEKASVTQIIPKEYGFRTQKSGDTTAGAEYVEMQDEARMLTGDGNIVEVEMIYSVVINNVYDFFYKVDDPWGTLHAAVSTVLRRNIQNKTIDDALLNKQQIETEVLPDIRNLIQNYQLGIAVREVRIQNIVVPQEVKAAYDDVNNAKNEKTKKLEEAEKYANEVLPAARAKAYSMIQAAEGYKAEKIAQAEGDVANFREILKKYAANKDITKLRLFIETFERIMSKVKTKYVIESDDGVLKFLPIEGAKGGN